MLPSLNPEQILALAPDPSSAQAGRGLANPRKWATLGHSAAATWGECQGSGKDPYRVQIDLREIAFRCSCPSRKFPCKHGIGLLLLLVTQPAAFTAADPPAWVAEWLAKRGQSAEKKAEKASSEQPAPSPKRSAAQARASAARETKVAAGLDELGRWLRDQVRQGLASTQGRGPAVWDSMAARMVDAQAPGVARMLRDMAGIPASGEGWQARLLDRMARVHLLIEGYRRIEALAPDLQVELRTQIGWAQDQEALRGSQGVRDSWLALGQRVEDEGQLRVQRTWLWGAATQRPALLLAFAPPGQPLDRSLVIGTALDADLAFFEGALPLRAIVAQRHAAPEPIRAMPGYASIAEAIGAYAGALARSPWLERFPLAIQDLTPAHDGEAWLAYDRAGQALALDVRPIQGWRLLGLSGGRPVGLFGEWNGEALTPLSAVAQGEFIGLRADG